MGAALAGASAPQLAHLLKSTEGNSAVNVIAHAILGGAVAAMQGNSAAAGAAGAATGELAARAIAGMLYPDVTDLSQLSEDQKQTISTLATISAGMDGTGFGYNIGASITNKFESQYIKNQPGMDASKYSLKYSEKSIGYGIYQGSQMSPYPGILGGFGGSVISEWTGNVTQKEANGESK